MLFLEGSKEYMMMEGKKILLIFLAAVAAGGMSCTSVWNKKYKDDAGVMYGMIYDEKEEGVAAVNVMINGKLKAVSDGQGRFILQFYFADIKDKKEQRIELEKEGYEKFEQVFYYEPLSLLHLKLESGDGLLKEAEEAIDESEYGEAEKLLKRAFSIEEKRDESLYLQAVIRYKEGKREEAREALERMSGKGNAAVKAFVQRLEGVRE